MSIIRTKSGLQATVVQTPDEIIQSWQEGGWIYLRDARGNSIRVVAKSLEAVMGPREEKPEVYEGSHVVEP